MSTRINLKECELQPQHFLIRDLYRLCPLKVGRIIFGVVWRGDNTCGKAVFQVELKKGNLFLHLSLNHSPLLPQAQNDDLCCQSEDPVVLSGTQARLRQTESEHWPQQHCSPAFIGWDLQSVASRFVQVLPREARLHSDERYRQ